MSRHAYVQNKMYVAEGTHVHNGNGTAAGIMYNNIYRQAERKNIIYVKEDIYKRRTGR